VKAFSDGKGEEGKGRKEHSNLEKGEAARSPETQSVNWEKKETR